MKSTARTLTMIGATALALMVGIGPVEAKSKHHRDHDRHERGHRQHEYRDHDRHQRHDRHQEYRHRSHHDYRHDRYDRRPRRHVGHVRHHDSRFVVPVRIEPRYFESYRSYHYGDVYYAPHRHRHVAYRFPVYTSAGVAYRPHYYCGNELFVGYDRDHGRVTYHGRNVSFSIGF